MLIFYDKALALGFPTEADDILHTDHPYGAMMTGNSLNSKVDTIAWNDQKRINMMEKVLEIKYEQCPEFREKLLSTMNKLLVEATTNEFWASGLKPRETMSLQPHEWPGQNMLGKLLMKLRSNKMLRPPNSLNSDTAIVSIACDLLSKAANPQSVGLTSPEIIQMADKIISTPRGSRIPPPLPPKPIKRSSDVLSPLSNDPKRDIPSIDMSPQSAHSG